MSRLEAESGVASLVANAPKRTSEAITGFGEAFGTFFQKEMILRMLALAFFYRFGIYPLEKVGNVFLVANRAEGGLGLSNEAAGAIIGGWGSAALLAASVLGGITLAKIGLNRGTLMLFSEKDTPARNGATEAPSGAA